MISKTQRLKFFIENFLRNFFPNFLLELRIMRLRSKYLPREFIKHVESLDNKSLVIDVGANIGIVSAYIAKTGADVISFEPNKHAYQELKKIAKRYPNIKTHESAAGVSNRKVNLFLHKNYDDKYSDYSESSSLNVDKLNVSANKFQKIFEIDFAIFLKKLPKKVSLIKIDIEGYEIELLNHLLDENALKNVDKIYLETHENKFDNLVHPTNLLKQRIKNEGLSYKFFYEWH